MSVAATPVDALTRWLPALDPTCLRLLLLFAAKGDTATDEADEANDPADGPGGGYAIAAHEIADVIGVQRGAVRQHIRHLRDAQLLAVRARYYYCDCDCKGNCTGGCCGECGSSNTRAANAYIINRATFERGPR